MNNNNQDISILQEIRSRFPNMTEPEVHLEFIIQMWLAAMDGRLNITEDNGHYYFTGADINDDLPGSRIKAKDFYDRALVDIIINGIESGFIFIVDITDAGDYAIKNSHEIDANDFFVHALPKNDAIEFAKKLVD